MDRPKPPERIPILARAEPTRLRMQWLALAYEKLCPLNRLRLGAPPPDPAEEPATTEAFHRPKPLTIGA
jgi:hypothetical protein